MNQHVVYEPCPSCRADGRDKKGQHLMRFPDGGANCVVCSYYEKQNQEEEEDINTTNLQEITKLPFAALNARGISERVAKEFGVRVEYNPETREEVAYYYPITRSGETVGYQVRRLPKDFYRVGSTSKADLFGQNNAGANGKLIIVTEGQDDAMAAREILLSRGKNYRVVASLGAGAWGNSVEWLSTFENVVICFDQDEEGKKGAKKLIESLPPGKGRLMRFSEKDTNEMLLANKGEEFMRALSNSEAPRPDGVLDGRETWELVSNRPKVISLPYPDVLGDLQHRTGGRRLGEITIFSSGTGCGKTQVLRQLRHHDTLYKDQRIVSGVISLEESVPKAVDGLVALEMRQRLSGVPEPHKLPGYYEAWKKLHEEGKNHYYKSGGLGTKDGDSIINKMRYFHHVLGVNAIYLDHLTLAVAEMEGEDNSREDRFMSKLVNFVQECPVWVGLVVQLRKQGNSSKSFERGAIPDLDDLKGSGAIKQGAADIVFMSRDMYSEDEVVRNASRITLGKCRETGNTGPAGFLSYDSESGWMEKRHNMPEEGEGYGF